MGITLLDKNGLPPTGARVYVKSKHGIGTVRSLNAHSVPDPTVRVTMEGTGDDMVTRDTVTCKGDDLIVIGPPELLGNCAIDTCPICEETIRVRKHEL